MRQYASDMRHLCHVFVSRVLRAETAEKVGHTTPSDTSIRPAFDRAGALSPERTMTRQQSTSNQPYPIEEPFAHFRRYSNTCASRGSRPRSAVIECRYRLHANSPNLLTRWSQSTELSWQPLSLLHLRGLTHQPNG
jgi:hypothetical protein